MRNKLIGVACLVLLAGAAVAGDIVTPEDNWPFWVTQADTVRIPVDGGLVGSVKVAVKGPAKATVSRVTTRVRGRSPIHPGNQVVDVTPNGKGKVSVEITETSLLFPNAPPMMTTYEFVVE